MDYCQPAIVQADLLVEALSLTGTVYSAFGLGLLSGHSFKTSAITLVCGPCESVGISVAVDKIKREIKMKAPDARLTNALDA
jgi:hypothetical protein